MKIKKGKHLHYETIIRYRYWSKNTNEYYETESEDHAKNMAKINGRDYTIVIRTETEFPPDWVETEEEPRMCTCGCGLGWEDVIQVIMNTSDLNYDQAEDSLIRAEARRKERREEG